MMGFCSSDFSRFYARVNLSRHYNILISYSATLPVFQVGFILWFGSALAIVYAFFFFLGFNFLILIIEEPILRNQFGAAYEEYCKRVPRWIPKLRRLAILFFTYRM